MAIQTTRWSPDTCQCVIEYTWDDTVPEDSRVHSLGAYRTKCSLHTALSDSSAYTEVAEQNPRKNKIIERARVQFPRLFGTNGNFLGTWSFDSNRVLHVIVTGLLTTNQISNIQSWCDTNLGVGKVIIS